MYILFKFHPFVEIPHSSGTEGRWKFRRFALIKLYFQLQFRPNISITTENRKRVRYNLFSWKKRNNEQLFVCLPGLDEYNYRHGIYYSLILQSHRPSTKWFITKTVNSSMNNQIKIKLLKNRKNRPQWEAIIRCDVIVCLNVIEIII